MNTEQNAADNSGTGTAANTGDSVLLNDNLAAAGHNFLNKLIRIRYIDRVHSA